MKRILTNCLIYFGVGVMVTFTILIAIIQQTILTLIKIIKRIKYADKSNK